MAAQGEADQTLSLRLSSQEVEAIQALAQGLRALKDREVDEADAVVAAVELGLTRARDEYEIPCEEARARVAGALEVMQDNWIRGNACL